LASLKKKNYPHLKIKDSQIDLADLTSFGLKEMVKDLSKVGRVQSCKLTAISINLAVPQDEAHEFWSRRDLRKGDGKFGDGIAIKVEAFGTSVEDARNAAMARLLAFVNDCREQIHPSSRLRSVSLPEHLPYNFEDDPALLMAKEMSKTYTSQVEMRILGESAGWDSVSKMMQKLLKSENVALHPLIKYYLVCGFSPLPPSLYHCCCFRNLIVIKASALIHQKRREDAICELESSLAGQAYPSFQRLVQLRLKEAHRIIVP
jgi:hypothetical protein